MGALVEGNDGNFYGTNYYGGTIFRITPSGTLTPLHYFCYPNEDNGCPSGAGPAAPLVQ
jgi:hypothetical protein